MKTEEIHGEFRLKWDGRRYYVPAALRRLASEPWVLTRHTEGLRLHCWEEWQALLEMIRKMKDREKKEVLIRNVISPAKEVSFSKKGLYIPEPLRRSINGKDAMIVFSGRSGEIHPWK